eukprot:768384-Hanusia_phi.AAC.4
MDRSVATARCCRSCRASSLLPLVALVLLETVTAFTASQAPNLLTLKDVQSRQGRGRHLTATGVPRKGSRTNAANIFTNAGKQGGNSYEKFRSPSPLKPAVEVYMEKDCPVSNQIKAMLCFVLADVRSDLVEIDINEAAPEIKGIHERIQHAREYGTPQLYVFDGLRLGIPGFLARKLSKHVQIKPADWKWILKDDPANIFSAGLASPRALVHVVALRVGCSRIDPLCLPGESAVADHERSLSTCERNSSDRSPKSRWMEGEPSDAARYRALARA